VAGQRSLQVVPPKVTSLRRLWLIAHQGNWNEAGRKDGKRLEWLTCPSKCNAQLWGCDGKTPKAGPLHERYPGRFGDWEIPYCPRKMLAEPDPFVSYVVGTYRDYKYGNVTGWPDSHTAAVVDAVRYLDGEIDSANAKAMQG